MNAGGLDGRVVDGRFELLTRLGGGGMGLVWRARDTALDREVALKEVRPPDLAEAAADPEAARLMRARVLREARALARIQHPNVVTIHHIVDTPEHPYPWLVMELVAGGSLSERLARGPLTVPEAAWVGRGVLSALRAAHAAGIQHRDVKPGNVLLRTSGATPGGSPAVGTPVLTDFGIAAVRDATALTAAGALIGSPEYIAPERIRGQEGDPASDLWSLGMLLYVAVEGRHPLRRSTALATLAAVLDAPLPAPERAGALGPLLTALLVKDPRSRPDADRIDELLAAAERSAPSGGPAASPHRGAAPSTGTVHLAPPFPGQGGTPYPPDAGTPGGGTPGLPGPYPGPAAHGLGRTPPYTPLSYGPPSHGTPAPHAPAGRDPGRRRTGRIALAVLSSTTTIGLVTFGVWQLVPHAGPDGSRTGASSAPRHSAAGPLASLGTPTPGAGDSAGSTGGVSGGSSAAPSGTLLTPAAVRAVIAAMKPHMSGTKLREFTVYTDFATAEAPTPADPKSLDDLTYRRGEVTREPHETLDPGDALVNLSDYDWDALPQLLSKAEQTLKVPHPTLRYVVAKPDLFDDTPSLLVYLVDDYGAGYLEADPHGKVKEIYPKGS
ncbi:protein kinase [Streptomyces sp. NPDC020983]|uniref:serine/threonine-protein kinase n=1 Tax=Streptomyces sp. NPDC020983 TaxID=3365106 RepID=UPI0037917549